MKVAFPYPSYWPYVRRGAERCLHDIAQFLARRGHDVHIITSTPGRSRIETEGRVRITYLTQLSHPLVYRYAQLLRMYAFGLQATRVLAAERPDVVHMQSYSGVMWAPLLRRFSGIPYLLQIIMSNHYWPGRIDRFMFAHFVRGADRLVALTRWGAEIVSREFGVACGVLPPPVDLDTFRPCQPRNTSRPEVLFTGDLADPRKGGLLLLRAWNRVHRRCPRARLVLAGSFGLGGFAQIDSGRTVLANLHLVGNSAARAAIELRGPGAVADLPAWYSQASVTVLPSVEEAFGMVLTESLACGTPVVSSAHHGPSEIVTSPEVGVTVDLKEWIDLQSPAKAEELADAILAAIELSSDPRTASRCRDWASRWSVERIGLAEEALLRDIVDSGRRKPASGRRRERQAA